MLKSNSYKLFDWCGEINCSYGNDDEVCWGQVEHIHEGVCSIYACQGHKLSGSYDGKKYTEEKLYPENIEYWEEYR
jgi:hypothetical protein